MRASISTRSKDWRSTHRPKLIIAGGSAYPRIIDFARFRAIADAVGAYLMVDMAHFAGLVAGGVHPSPLPHAHVVTTTTHKTLRGPRGGMILAQDEEIGKKINSAVFPGLQGGPLMHVIAAKAVALGEALRPEFSAYAAAVVENAKTLAATLAEAGLAIVSGGTDTHLMLVDLRPKGLTGRDAEQSLERAGITCNKNGIPFDPEKPTVTSGIRLGSPAATTRGFGPAEFRKVGELIVEVLRGLAQRCRRERRGRSAGARQGRASFAPASRSIRKAGDRAPTTQKGERDRGRNALSVLRSRRHPGQGFAADRRSRRDPPAPLLPELRRALHHLRAGAAARADRRQEERPARAVRPRQARALDRISRCASARSSPTGSSASSTRSCASSKARARPTSRAT